MQKFLPTKVESQLDPKNKNKEPTNITIEPIKACITSPSLSNEQEQ